MSRTERNLDFDRVIERKHTASLKFDFALQRGKPEDVLPLWVADMDFQTSSFVQDALQERVEHGIFGYTETDYEYYRSIYQWMNGHFGWQPRQQWLIKTPGVVVALALAVKAYTKPGDSVLITQPVYYPFSEVILDNDRKVVSSDLVYKDHAYEIDFEDFEQKIIDHNVHLFLLCNPHNPVGRVWTKKELAAIAEICLSHNVIVVSDEIHQDFVWEPYRHTVFASLSSEISAITVTCTSPGKTFNLASLQVSNIWIENDKLREKFQQALNGIGYSQMNAMGITACIAAYENGEQWYNAMKSYVKSNIDFTREYVKEHIPQIQMVEPESTYLVWLDCSALSLTNEELEDLIINKAKLWLDSGAIFGKCGEGFQRINVACPRSTLKRALNQLETAINSIV